MDFRVLGPLEVSCDGAPVRIGSRMQRRLLALLLVHAGAVVSAERVIDVLWEGDPLPSAVTGLHAYVSRLRRLLGDGAKIASDARGYWLRVEEHDVDAWRFERLAAAARERLTGEPADAAATLKEALALWRGRAYEEFADEDFARLEAVRLDELRLIATEDAFAARLVCGDGGLTADLEAFAAANPLRERPHAQLMTALAQAGRQSEALGVFQRVRCRLADEGLEPSPALQQLQTDVLRQTPRVMPPAASGAEAGGVEAAAGNLPRPVTSFLGRRHETEAVCRLLERGRLVTLTGVGGVGKTRLALQVAAAITRRYSDGVWCCELAPADPDSVSHTVAELLGVQQQANRSITDSIAAALAGKQLLLVLDNCEHVAAACAQLAEHLLRSCAHVCMLVTSREPLAAEGEQVWVVPPLPLPSGRAEEDAAAPAAQLFCDRARAYHAGFTVDATTAGAVADICRQLDGLPLAIELAAALVPALEPAEIARRLGQRFRLLTHGPRTNPRHRSLRAVVEWSYQLLEPDEQRLFDRLAVFAGGFTLAAAEGVCADEDLAAERIAGLLASLVNRSMVAVGRSTTPARYHLLESLRCYAAERLTGRGEEPALRARHAAWFVDLAEHADIDVRGPGEAAAVTRLEAEFANLRAAHRWAIERDDADLALRLAAALHIFARLRLRDEVFVWAEQAAGLPSAVGHRLQPMVWGVAALGISSRGELTRARELAARALTAAPEDDGPARFVPLRVLASIARLEGRLADSRDYTRQARAAARRHGDAYYLCWMQVHEALALSYGGQREAGLGAALAAREAADALGTPHLQAWGRYAHAEACGDDDPEQALRLLEVALDLAEPVHDRFLEGVGRVAVVSLRARHQTPREALPAFPDVIAHWRRVGDWTHQWLTLRNLVPLLVRLEAYEPAALLYGAQRAAATAPPAYGDDADRLAEAHETLAARLGTATFAALLAQGERLTEDHAADLALGSIAELLAEENPRDDGSQPPAPRPRGRSPTLSA